MKTIEQKAKAYDEALDKSKEFYILCKKCGAKDTVDFLEDCFSELRKNEDERIRKALISVFSNREKYLIDQSFGDITVAEALAWLEKQGRIESDPRYENLEELLAADDIYQMSMNDEMVREAKEKAVNALSGMCIGRLLGFE